MLKEILHFAVHAPKTLALKRKLSQTELYDTLMLRAEAAGMAMRRASLVEELYGRVLEIGCGTGLMFSHYPERVRLYAIELGADFLRLAQNRVEKSPFQISLVMADGQMLPFATNAFDYVIIALVLCSVSSVERVLTEVKRVLRRDGELRLIEHVRSEHRFNGKLMDLLNPLWLALNKQGCNMNRKTESLLEQNGFKIKESKPFKTFTPGMPTFPKRWIRAVPA
ncbi:MAG: class I SAM-dependent methyltransferase [bacterium]